MPNWNKIRTEYINGNISYRKLAEKHGVSKATLTEKAIKGKWYEKRKEQHSKITAKTEQKTAELIAEREAERLIRISNAADKLLAKIEEATEQLDQFIVTSKVRQKEVEYETAEAGFGKVSKETVKDFEDKRIVQKAHLDRAGLKTLTSALKDLRDIQFAKAEEEPQDNDKIVFIEDLKPDE